MPRATVLACALFATACAPAATMVPVIEAAPTAVLPTTVDAVSLGLDFRTPEARGFARLVQHADHLEIELIVEGAIPGEHDICVHEYGDCSDQDFMRAGVHYDPLTTDPDDTGYHTGDIGILRVASDGRGELKIDKTDLTLAEVVGRAVIMHAEADHGHDHSNQGAGFRTACGSVQPGDTSRLAEVERELMDLRHYVQRLGTTMATAHSH